MDGLWIRLRSWSWRSRWLCVRITDSAIHPPKTEPYIRIPLRVMLGVGGVRARAMAGLHDVLEDTAVTAEALREANLSSEVVDAVTVLTRRSGQTCEQYVAQVVGNAIARPVKLADLADNVANNKRLTTRPDVVARIERREPAIRWLQAPDVPS